MHYQRRAKPAPAQKPPSLVINIAVDTTHLYVQSSRLDSGMGIYMTDNDAASGSTGEGTAGLAGKAKAGSGVAFNVFPINAMGELGDDVQIVGIELSDGSHVFGQWGLPKRQSSTSSYQWVGTATMQGVSNCQLRISVSAGNSPLKYFEWAPFIRCAA